MFLPLKFFPQNKIFKKQVLRKHVYDIKNKIFFIFTSLGGIDEAFVTNLHTSQSLIMCYAFYKGSLM